MSVNLIWVLIGCALIGGGASVVGSFAFLRKQSLVGDAVAHSLLPGVALSFLIFEEKNLWVLFPGALIAGWLSLWESFCSLIFNKGSMEINQGWNRFYSEKPHPCFRAIFIYL